MKRIFSATLVSLVAATALLAQSSIGVERDPTFPLWLPSPGPSTSAPLLPRADAARVRGLDAARGGRWEDAVDAFMDAQEGAHCSPSVMYNLGLAYQRGGYTVPAAMWYRAYLAADRGASNAASVSAETDKLIAQTEANAIRLLAEAERFADALPDRAATRGIKSPRQQALETIGNYSLWSGTPGGMDGLLAKVDRLASESGTTNQIRANWDQHGVYGAIYAQDAARAEEILARWGQEYDRSARTTASLRRQLYKGPLPDLDRLTQLIGTAWVDEPQDAHYVLEARGFDQLEAMHMRTLSAVAAHASWMELTLLRDIEEAFWGGRPDVARRLATRAIASLDQMFPGDSSWIGFMPDGTRGALRLHLLAFMVDIRSITDYQRRFRVSITNEIPQVDYLHTLMLGQMSLVLAAVTPQSSAAAVVDTALEHQWPAMSRVPGRTRENTFGLVYFGRAALNGDNQRALAALDASQGFQHLERRAALRFAVATRRTSLALAVAGTTTESADTLVQLQRLARSAGANASVRQQVEGYAAAACGGWRPRDDAHAWAVWRRIRHARFLNDRAQYGPFPEDIDKTAKDRPEKLPGELAGHAAVLWMGALAARAEQ